MARLRGDDLVDETVVHRLLGGHEEVAVAIVLAYRMHFSCVDDVSKAGIMTFQRRGVMRSCLVTPKSI